VSPFANRLAAAEKNFRQLALLALIYLLLSVHAMSPVDDPDIWWHLRTGQWIVEHGRVPFTDPFASHLQPQPWIAYSWLFEILIYEIFSFFGLMGITLFTVAFGFLIALALHALVRRANLSLAYETGLTAAGLVSIIPLMSPRPWLFSILFFILELNLILKSRRFGTLRSLYWLPLIFIIWANLHIQFVYGLALLFFAAMEPFLQRLLRFRSKTNGQLPALSPGLLAATGVCILATIATPYELSIYRPILQYATETKVFRMVLELQPLPFRSPANWVFLALMLGAAFSLGWRREASFFPFCLLAMGALLSFRAQRDVWVGAVAAVGVMSDRATMAPVPERVKLTKAKIVIVAVVLGAALFFFARSRNITETALKAIVAERFPADAVAFVKKNQIRGPLYNHFDWGGFLIWSLPEIPVSIDGRTNVYGEEKIERCFMVWSGVPGWNSDPDLIKAKLIIGDIRHPLTFSLRADARFKLIYEDRIAAVFAAAAPGVKKR
jgi:hypothetical protein